MLRNAKKNALKNVIWSTAGALIGSVVAQFAWQATHDKLWMVALERSYFQAMMAVLVATLIFRGISKLDF